VVGYGLSVSTVLLFTLLVCSCGLHRKKKYKLEAFNEDPFNTIPRESTHTQVHDEYMFEYEAYDVNGDALGTT